MSEQDSGPPTIADKAWGAGCALILLALLLVVLGVLVHAVVSAWSWI